MDIRISDEINNVKRELEHYIRLLEVLRQDEKSKKFADASLLMVKRKELEISLESYYKLIKDLVYDFDDE